MHSSVRAQNVLSIIHSRIRRMTKKRTVTIRTHDPCMGWNGKNSVFYHRKQFTSQINYYKKNRVVFFTRTASTRSIRFVNARHYPCANDDLIGISWSAIINSHACNRYGDGKSSVLFNFIVSVF